MRKLIMGAMFACPLVLAGEAVFAAAPSISINNQTVKLEQEAFEKDNRTFIPLRAVAAELGSEIEWDGETQTIMITQGLNKITCKIGSKMAEVNNEAVTLDVAPQIKDGVTYVPVRFVAETLGAQVGYDSGANTVSILTGENKKEQPKEEKPKEEVKKEETVQRDPFGRKIRKTNLPKNANQYLYIVEGVPNAMYEQPFVYTLGKNYSNLIEGEDYIRPANMVVMDKRYYNEENVKLWKVRTEEYLKVLFNIDYRKLDQKWIDKMVSMKHKTAKSYWTRSFKEVMQYYKDNHIITQGEFKVEPSIIYSAYGGNYIRCYVKYQIKSDNAKQVSFEDEVTTVKPNTWYEGYVDIKLGTNDMGSCGDDYVVAGISDLTNTQIVKPVK